MQFNVIAYEQKSIALKLAKYLTKMLKKIKIFNSKSIIELVLPIKNESSNPLRLCLEPLCEYFIIQPGQRVKVHAIFNKNTKNLNFTLAPNDGFLIIYAPGEILGFVDCFVTSQNVKLLPVE